MSRALSWRIRTDSRPSSGQGHLSRSGALARALACHVPVQVVLDPGTEAVWGAHFEREGITVSVEGSGQVGPWAGTVLDGYEFSSESVAGMAREGGPLVVLDDFFSPPHAAAFAINAAPGLTGNSVNGIPALLGSRYALLNERFRDLPAPQIAEDVAHIVVTLGRHDVGGVLGLVLTALAIGATQGWQPRCTVVAGPTARKRPEVLAAITSEGSRMTLQTDVSDMATLYRSADLVIGAGGVGLLERMASGVPSITIELAPNQRLQLRGAAALGATLDVGMVSDLSPEGLQKDISRLAGDPALRRAMSKHGRKAVDGRGADRVAAALLDLARTWIPVKAEGVRT